MLHPWIRKATITAEEAAQGMDFVRARLEAQGIHMDADHPSQIAHPWKQEWDTSGNEEWFQGRTKFDAPA